MVAGIATTNSLPAGIRMADTDTLALSRLLQLASPLLPVGAYSYSQGLEWAIEAGTVVDADSALLWIGDAMQLSLCRFELPILWRLRQCWEQGDDEGLARWNRLWCAGRDNAEARAETLQMGYSLARLLNELNALDAQAGERLRGVTPASFPLAYAVAASVWFIDAEKAQHAYAWSWAENQVSAALKAVPLGQVAGQRLLLALGSRIADAVTMARTLDDDEISNFAPGLALAGCLHETQYSRLFRS